LWAGGYLTSKGAQVLYCPSNNSCRKAKETKNDKRQRYDENEPFWTSNAKIVRGDNDALGDAANGYFTNEYGERFWFCSDGTSPRPTSATSNVVSGVCTVFNNYSLRVAMPQFVTNINHWTQWAQSAVKLEEAGREGIVADSLEFFLDQSKNPAVYGGGTGDTLYKSLYGNHLITNHDMSYNVLFSDGAVKTYGDAGKEIFKDIADLWVVIGQEQRAIDIREVDRRVWKAYLNTAYQQD